MRTSRSFLCIAALLVMSFTVQGQSWTKLTNTPPGYLGTALLLTDGTVMVEAESSSGGGTTGWYLLTPSSTGSYVNGTWTTLAAMPTGYDPLYFTSAVLADGKVVVVGGEYLGTTESETNKGAIYNPATNTWTKITPPTGWTHIGDGDSVVLANGTYMIGNCGVAGTECTNQTYQAQLNESTLTWTIIGAGNGKADQNSEEGWNLLPNGEVLVADVWDGTNSELFNPTTSTWSTAGSTVVALPDTNCEEIGPAVLRPQGSVFAVGGTSNTAVYTTSTGTWAAGPVVPNSYGVEDGPASILPDGNVLIQEGPTSTCYIAPSVFYEFNGSTLTSVPAPTNAPNDPTYVGRMLALPTGQVLWTDGTKTAEVYTAAGTYQSAWAPTISTVSSVLASASTSNAISGTQFNGLTQGAAYGDDAEMATNYPLVRITNTASGNVVYAKTHDHSTMGVATGSATVSTEFDIPSTIQLGPSELVVVANGIPSAAASVAIQDATATAVTATPNSIATTGSTTLAATVTDTSNAAHTPTGTVTFTDTTNSASLGSCTLSSGTCSISGAGSAMAVGSNTISAAYAGVTDTYTASSGTVMVTVTSSQPTPTVAVANVTAGYGTNVALSATDTGTGGVAPTGAVTFTVNGATAPGAPSCSASGAVQTCSENYALPGTLTDGSYTIGASFAADSNYTMATGTGTLTVQMDNTGTTVTATPNSIASSGTTTLQATVTCTGGGSNVVGRARSNSVACPSPTGTVTFTDTTNSDTLANCTLSGGTCSATANGSAMAFGANTITASYAGASGEFNASSGTTTVAVTADATSTSVTATPSSIATTGSTSLAATVSDITSSGTLPAGTVTFTDTTNSASLGSCTLASGTCSVTAQGSAMALGSNSITANYAGVSGSFGASSGTTPVMVTAAPANVITFSSVSHNFGQVAVGTAAMSYSLAVKNTSTTMAYPFSLVFTASKGFTSANNCGTSIAAGKSCELVFYFTPAATGPVSTTWSLASESGFSYSPSDGGTLQGSGTTQGGVSLTSAGHNFGTVSVGSTSPTYGTELSNSTSAAVTLSLGSVTAPFHSMTNCGTTLAAGASCELEFTFVPTGTGTVQQVFALSGSVTITAGGNPLPNGGITLKGN